MKDEFFWTASAYLAVAGAALVALAGLAIYLRVKHERWLPLQRLRPGRWAGYEVFVAFCVVNGLPILIVAVLLQMGFFTPLIGPSPDLEKPGRQMSNYILQCDMLASPLTLLTTLGVLFAILYLRSDSRPPHYGLTKARWPANFALGLAAFVVITPIVLGWYALITLGQTEEKHPFVEVSQDLQPWQWFFLFFQAVVQAPLLEEILFRGILLGWLRRASLPGHIVVGTLTILAAVLQTRSDPPALLDYALPVGFAVACVAGYVYLLIRMARRLCPLEVQSWQPAPSKPLIGAAEAGSEEMLASMRHEMRAADERRQDQWNRANARLAVYGSAMIFAVFHTAVWPAPVALIVLALALGWLALRTQSLIPSITLHATFNLVSSIALMGSTMASAE